ncbi:MAG: glycoside hydrolase family 5 protein [Oscillospiraceae bacterium]|nr:glycoside hydrolase family 5 protein [Oscillospiraceae bacterium]
MNIRKIISLAAASVLTVTMLAGCGGKSPDSAEQSETESVPEPTAVLTATELVKEMKLGWNLGNTLDASQPTWTKVTDAVKFETSWGNVQTTQEIIDTVKAAGFNIVRIPVTWDVHIGDAPDYIIQPEWMARVKEVVNYAYGDGTFVILNLHHEEWHYPSEENYPAASEKLKAVWTQIAAEFADYDQHLIFEGMNEPRMKGTPQEWTGGTPEAREVINKLNADFVSTIRAQGGNNPDRCLMIPTIAASGDSAALQGVTVPEDDKVIVSIHAYKPYSFALDKNGTKEYNSETDTNEIDTILLNLKTNFLDKGIPVVIGEYGFMNKENIDARVAALDYYLSAARSNGIPCVWWDNGAFIGSGENFGLLDRSTCTWKYPELMEVIKKYSE